MYSFANDYSEGACPSILEALIRTNNTQTAGYGLDIYCKEAAGLIKKQLGREDVDIHFVTGGTPANLLASCLLKAHEAMVCVQSGHINVHETGAVESAGHKILTAEGVDGKITAKEIESICKSHADEHMVKPRMVFISDATEFGTIYTKKELSDLSETCHKLGLYLYLDGARLANALTAQGNDLTLRDIAGLVDMFYIGGTKNGALIGEAMVIVNDELKPDFRYVMKQRGSMLAKGRLIGIQFRQLFRNDLFYVNGRNANIMAQALKYILLQRGIKMYIDSPTNQIFPILDNTLLEKIKTQYIVTEWGPYDDEHTIVRFVCSWATKKADIQQFYNDLVRFVND